MKKLAILLLATPLLCCSIVAQTTFKYEGNPLIRDIFTADPTARVFDGRLYVYTSHDRDDATSFNMNDWAVLSSDDMINWRADVGFFGLDDIAWADHQAWAPDCVERGGKYYFYYPVERSKIGVAVSDNPTSGFIDSGKPLIDNTNQIEHIGPEPIDPTVIVERGQAYMYFGCREFRMVKLKDNMVEIDGEVVEPQIIGNENDPQHFGGFYGEGPFIFKRKGVFYLLYANGWGPTSTIVYATSTSPEGPFTYQGEVMDPVSSNTSHGSMVKFKGEWYIFYHTMDISGKGCRRSVAFDKISFDKDGRIVKPTITRNL